MFSEFCGSPNIDNKIVDHRP
ncbi:tryptophanase leader peptide [Escherichia coli]